MVRYYKYSRFVVSRFKFYRKNPWLLSYDFLILYTLTGILIIGLNIYVLELLILHTILLLILFVVLIRYKKIYSCYELSNYLVIMFLHMSFLNIIYNCLPLSTTTFPIIFIIILLLCSALYTLYLLRFSKITKKTKTTMWEILKQIWQNFKKISQTIKSDYTLMFLLILTCIICVVIRCTILFYTSILFSHCICFCIFYLIVFSLWLPFFIN